MFKHPETGKFISKAEYEAIMAEREEKQSESRPVEYGPAPVRQVSMQSGNSFNPMGCVVPMMAAMMLFMLVGFGVGGYLLWQANRTPAPPVPAPNVVPVNPSLDALTNPIKQKLAYDPAKAKKAFAAYAGFRDAMMGPSGRRVTDTRVFASVHSALLQDVDAGGGTPIGRDIDQAIASHLGISWGRDTDGKEGWEFKSFNDSDRMRLAEILGAISSAAESTL